MFFRKTGFGVVLLGFALAPAAQAASPQVQAAETSVYVNLSMMHTQYHENASPGDDESGYTPGFGVGVSALIPTHPGNPGGLDFYTMLDYQFAAGNLKYAGTLVETNPTTFVQTYSPFSANDRTVFQRIEARIGAGIPLQGGAESIPFVAVGYQAWNRNVDSPITTDGGEFYHSWLGGAGLKLDVPLSGTFVASVTPEFLGLYGGGITGNGYNFGRGFGVTPEERVEIGLDDALGPHLHVFAKGYWEHFNYSGTHPEYFQYYSEEYYIYEPLSTTTQLGVSAGVGYSF